MNYAKYCGLALARAHANTGSAAAIAGYLGTSSKVDKAFAQFGVAYADQTEHDHRALVEAIDSGRDPRHHGNHVDTLALRPRALRAGDSETLLERTAGRP